jgi:hypothetical protein
MLMLALAVEQREVRVVYTYRVSMLSFIDDCRYKIGISLALCVSRLREPVHICWRMNQSRLA